MVEQVRIKPDFTLVDQRGKPTAEGFRFLQAITQVISGGGTFQPLSAILTGVSSMGPGTGLVTQVGASTFNKRTLAASSPILITNPDGVSGNPTFSGDIASNAEAIAGVDTTKIIVSSALAAALASAGSGYQPLDADLTSWAAIARAAGYDTFAATPSSANLLALLTDETGTGAAVFSTSASMTTPFITGPAVVGNNAALAIAASGTVTPHLQQIGTDAATAAMGLACFSTTAAVSSQINAYKSANASIGSATVVANNDRIFALNAFGAQQTGTFSNQQLGAQMLIEVDGVVTSGASLDMPMRWVWKTTTDAGTSTERLRIANDGKITSSNGGLVAGGWFGRTVPTTVTTDFTVSASDNYIISNRAATNTGTLPSAASFPGREITIKTITAQTVVSASGNVVPLVGGAAGTAILAATAGKWATLVSDSANWIIMAGN